MKVISKYKGGNTSMNEVLPYGFETELEIKRSKEDEVISDGISHYTNEKGEVIGWCQFNGHTVPSGNFEGFSFVGANGERYDHTFINHSIGPKPLSHIFNKL